MVIIVVNYKVWTINDIREVLDEFGEKVNMSCSHIPIEISDKKNTMGSFVYQIEYCKKPKLEPLNFVFSNELLNGDYSEDDVIQTIGHEYVHFYTIIGSQKKQGHSKKFKENCKKIGISDSTYFKGKPKKLDNSYKYTIVCKKCGNVFGRHRIPKEYEKYYCCKICEGKLDVKKNW